MNYYNEHDPHAAAWLEELITLKLIPNGKVDTRSIVEVEATDLEGFTQHHFFAGIGGWCEALRLAGWPQDQEIWTASLPCQPFSSAGKSLGQRDERHLWPTFRELVAECQPSILFGEQTESKDGREWLAGVQLDLEGLGYSFGGADLCAAGTGAPHLRQRLYWLAHAEAERRERSEASGREAMRRTQHGGRMGDTGGEGLQGHSGDEDRGNEPGREHSNEGGPAPEAGLPDHRMGDSDEIGRQGIEKPDLRARQWSLEAEGRPDAQRPDFRPKGMGDTGRKQRQRRGEPGDISGAPEEACSEAWQQRSRDAAGDAGEISAGRGFWNDFQIIECAEPKGGTAHRRIESGTFPLVARIPLGMVPRRDSGEPTNEASSGEARTMRIRGYGNAIVPQLAATFIQSATEAINELNTQR